MLEHVADLDAVIRETARVLKPGGLYLFDTINRTRLSKLVMIKLPGLGCHRLACMPGISSSPRPSLVARLPGMGWTARA